MYSRIIGKIIVLLVFAFASVGTAARSAQVGGPSAHIFVQEATQSSGSERLLINKKSVMPGSRAFVKIENLGSKELTYGYEYDLARQQGGKWIKEPLHPVFQPAFRLKPMQSSPWQGISVRKEAQAGTYRIRKWVYPIPSRKVTIAVTFHVRARL
jgi:hypothetical protein